MLWLPQPRRDAPSRSSNTLVPTRLWAPTAPPGAGKPSMDSSPLYRPSCPHQAAWPPPPRRLTPHADHLPPTPPPWAALGRRAMSPGPVTVQGQAPYHRHTSRVRHRVLPRQHCHPRQAHGAGARSPAHTPAAPTLQPPAPPPAPRSLQHARASTPCTCIATTPPQHRIARMQHFSCKYPPAATTAQRQRAPPRTPAPTPQLTACAAVQGPCAMGRHACRGVSHRSSPSQHEAGGV